MALIFFIVRFSEEFTCKTVRVNFLSELNGLGRIPKKLGLTADHVVGFHAFGFSHVKKRDVGAQPLHVLAD